MASRKSTVDFIVEQAAAAGMASARKMFGEYGIFCDGNMVALVCDDQLFVKPTAAGRVFVGEPIERPPYQGAKPCFIVTGDKWGDGGWLAELVRMSAAGLPMPPRKRRIKAKTGV